MKKNQLYIIIGSVVVLALAGWGLYKHFSKKTTTISSTQAKLSAESFAKNSCWLYHEYVYRVDFGDTALKPFFFIRNSDGTFSPSQADSTANTITGNGFFIDSTGACMITEKMARPWVLSDEEQEPLNEMLNSWLAAKDEVINKGYHVTGQTVALFAVLNDYKNFIEYNVSAAVPGQEGYSIAYPVQKINLTGLNMVPAFSKLPVGSEASIYKILKTVLNNSNANNPVAQNIADSISAILDNTAHLDKITLFKGDGFFYEGSVVFDTSGNILGNLHYDNSKWKLVPMAAFIQNPPAYSLNEPQEGWAYDSTASAWNRVFKKIAAGEPADDH